MGTRYRKLNMHDFQRAITFCEQNRIDFDLWNAEEVWFGNADFAEFGVSELDFITVDHFLGGIIERDGSMSDIAVKAGLRVRGARRIYIVRHNHLDWFIELVRMIQGGGAMLPDHSSTTDLGVYFDSWYEEWGDSWEVLEDWENFDGP